MILQKVTEVTKGISRKKAQKAQKAHKRFPIHGRGYSRRQGAQTASASSATGVHTRCCGKNLLNVFTEGNGGNGVKNRLATVLSSRGARSAPWRPSWIASSQRSSQ